MSDRYRCVIPSARIAASRASSGRVRVTPSTSQPPGWSSCHSCAARRPSTPAPTTTSGGCAPASARTPPRPLREAAPDVAASESSVGSVVGSEETSMLWQLCRALY
eukprot:scaffold60366_cov33-Phaeocystis_antarctica.AAC.1